MIRQALSSNHYSHDDQVVDAMNYLYSSDRPAYDAIVAEFPEYEHAINEVFRRQASTDSWLDTAAAGVDVEYMMRVTDAIEAKSSVYWEDGEPWVGEDPEPDGYLCQDCLIWVANGDDSGMDDDAIQRVTKATDHRQDENWVPGDSDGAHEFSWQPCDRCGTTLGGSRHLAFVIS